MDLRTSGQRSFAFGGRRRSRLRRPSDAEGGLIRDGRCRRGSPLSMNDEVQDACARATTLEHAVETARREAWGAGRGA